LSGPEHAADGVYGTSSMAEARKGLRREHGGLPAYKFFLDRVESRVRDGSDAYLLEGEAWYGGDIDKLWVKAELEGEYGAGVEGAEVQGLWSQAIDPWFDVQAGVRYDPRKGPDRGHLVLGVQGLAPYWWEVDGAIFLSNKGEVTARAEAEYDLRVTQKLILQPRAEIDLSLQDIPELQTGAGVTSAALGARLRYQVTPLLAPYVGVEYERAFGDTRRFLREDGDSGGWNLLGGVRLWF
jgi:copper resistance protein B